MYKYIYRGIFFIVEHSVFQKVLTFFQIIFKNNFSLMLFYICIYFKYFSPLYLLGKPPSNFDFQMTTYYNNHIN